MGANNYRYFYLFLFWTTLVIIFFLSASWPAMKHAIDWMLMTQEDRKFESFDRSMMIMAFAVAAAVGIGVLAFLVFHTYLSFTNQTTMEWATSGGPKDEILRRSGKFRRNPYDIGKNGNWSQIFGFGIRDFRWMFCWITPVYAIHTNSSQELSHFE